jgi:hypothetical protein
VTKSPILSLILCFRPMPIHASCSLFFQQYTGQVLDALFPDTRRAAVQIVTFQHRTDFYTLYLPLRSVLVSVSGLRLLCLGAAEAGDGSHVRSSGDPLRRPSWRHSCCRCPSRLLPLGTPVAGSPAAPSSSPSYYSRFRFVVVVACTSSYFPPGLGAGSIVNCQFWIQMRLSKARESNSNTSRLLLSVLNLIK